MNNFIDLGIILAIVSLIYAYTQRNKHKKIVYDIVTRPLINFVNKEFYLSVNEQNFYQLSHTRIILRNEGEETIVLSDILEGYLSIEIMDNYDIIYSNVYTKGACNISFERINSKSLQIKFDHIFYEDEIFVDIYHTGTGNSQISVKCNATCQKSILRREYVSIPIPSLVPRNKRSFVESFYISIITAFLLFHANTTAYISSLLQQKCEICIPDNIILLILSILVYIILLSIFNYRYWRGLRNIKDL